MQNIENWLNQFFLNWKKYNIKRQNKHRHLRGIYLIQLNRENKCDYFLMCGELNK